MELQPRRVSREAAARQPTPDDGVLAFLDPLLGRAALVVEGDHPLGRSRHVGHHDVHLWAMFLHDWRTFVRGSLLGLSLSSDASAQRVDDFNSGEVFFVVGDHDAAVCFGHGGDDRVERAPRPA
jgi:hypothetical protein